MAIATLCSMHFVPMAHHLPKSRQICKASLLSPGPASRQTSPKMIGLMPPPCFFCRASLLTPKSSQSGIFLLGYSKCALCSLADTWCTRKCSALCDLSIFL